MNNLLDQILKRSKVDYTRMSAESSDGDDDTDDDQMKIDHLKRANHSLKEENKELKLRVHSLRQEVKELRSVAISQKCKHINLSILRSRTRINFLSTSISHTYI